MAGNGEKNTYIDSENWVLAVLLPLFVILVGCGAQEAEATIAEAEAVTAAPAAVEDDVADTPTTIQTETTTTTTTTEAEAPIAAEVEPRFELIGEIDLTTTEINDMIEFVETAAGREFVEPPVIEMQSTEDFVAGLAPDAEIEAAIAENAESTARLYQALGYTGQGVDELATNLSAITQSTDLISGRYDPTDDAVYIPEGVLAGDEFNAILVHELLHALDDQYVDLGALIEQLEDFVLAATDTEEAFSIRAVVEGRATAVQFDWMFANNVNPSQPELPESLESVPAAVINSVSLPYQLGAQSIIGLGGPAETWHLYDEFPATSEQMIFPDRIGTDAPIEVAAPVVDGDVFFQGTNGVEGLLLIGLGDTLEPAPTLIFELLAAAEGWGGDTFVLSGDDTQSCLTGTIVADTPEDFAELDAFFDGWAERELDHPVTRTATVNGEALTISSCAPFIA